MAIDSHHHFWNYSAAEYPWISEQMAVLRQDYLPPVLQPEIAAAGIDGVISVQARQSVEETRWLCELAEQAEFVRGVVGWVPLADPNVERSLDEVANPWLKGVRHVVQDEPDDEFILGAEFNRGVARLKSHGLVYDILIYARHLPAAIRFVDRHPEQPMVLDHIGKPTIAAAEFDSTWVANLKMLAQRENVTCKFSGVATEIRDAEWTVETIRPYWDVALEAFSPSRLMYGSDWPVCLLRSSYARWVETVRELASELSAAEQEQFWSGTAMRAYGLG